MNTYSKEYKDWLAGLKVSDKVAIRRTHLSETTYRIVPIKRITKTGQIKVSGNDSKYKNGREMGNSGSWTGYGYTYFLKKRIRELKGLSARLETWIDLLIVSRSQKNRLQREGKKRNGGKFGSEINEPYA